MRMGPRGCQLPEQPTQKLEGIIGSSEERQRPGDYISWSPEQNRMKREDLEPQPTTTKGEEKNPVSTSCVCILTLRLNVHCKLEVSTMATLYSEYSCEYLC